MDLTRREFNLLMATLLASCSFEKKIVYRTFDLVQGIGHKIRDQKFNGYKVKSKRSIKNLIVGGGISGLSAAWHLAQKNQEFAIYELASQLGGNTVKSKNKAGQFPLGAHFIYSPPSEENYLNAYLEKIGISQRKNQFTVKKPHYHVLFGSTWQGDLLPVDLSLSDNKEINRFNQFLDSIVEKKSLHWDINKVSKVLWPLDKITVGKWLIENNYKSKPLRWYLDYYCREDYGGSIETISMLGLVFDLLYGNDEECILSSNEGNSAFTDPIVKIAEGQSFLQHALISITSNKQGHLATFFSELNDALFEVQCENVIFALPKYLLPFVYKGFKEPIFHWSYSPWSVVNFLIRSDQKVNHWDFLFENSSALGFVNSNYFERLDRNYINMTWYASCANANIKEKRAELLGIDEKKSSSQAQQELQWLRKYLGDYSIEEVTVKHWGHGMIRATENFLFHSNRKFYLDSYWKRKKVFFAHSDQEGMSMFNTAFKAGAEAAQTAMGLSIL